MRAAIFKGPGAVEAGERPDPVVQEPTDAVVRVVLGCVCGSDLWYYRGESPHAAGSIGHEFIGVVEQAGADVRGVREGDLVVAPFIYSDMSCPHCLNGSTISCPAGGNFGNGVIDGGQGEAVRVPLAGRTLVPVPGAGHPDGVLRSLLALSDVMSTGHHAAVMAGVKKEDTVAVVGDGAVGLCVGTAQSTATAFAVARPGSTVGIVGVPHGQVPFAATFFRNTGWRGGPAPARIYIPELLEDVLGGTIDPGRVFNYETDLDRIADAYKAMDERRAIKSLVRIGAI